MMLVDFARCFDPIAKIAEDKAKLLMREKQKEDNQKLKSPRQWEIIGWNSGKQLTQLLNDEKLNLGQMETTERIENI